MPVVEDPKIEYAGARVSRPQTRSSVSSSTLDSFEFWPGTRTKDDRGRSGETFRASVLPFATRLRAKWFWYSLMSLVCWTAWALTAKIGSSKLPASTMQFVSALGFLSVSIAIAGFAKRTARSSHKGKLYSVISGVLLAGGGLASFVAYRTGDNTAATTGITSLYPAITVICALVFLKERLTKSQIAGLCFSGLAILLFSL
jgi:uncharacterized membrane protein